MATKDPIEAISEYFNTPISITPTSDQIAKFILANTKPITPVPKTKPKGDKDPSLMGRIFDFLSRTNYAVAEFTREWVETGDPDLSAAWAGLSGEKKTTFDDVLGEAGMVHGPLRAGLGLGLDIFADPLTYVPVAGIASKFKRGSEVAKQADIADQPLAKRLLSKGEPVNPELFNLPPRQTGEIPEALRKIPEKPTQPRNSLILPTEGFNTRQLQSDLPGVSQRIPLPSSVDNVVQESTEQAVRGQLPLPFRKTRDPESPYSGKGRITKDDFRRIAAESPTRIVDNIAQGNIQEAMKLAPLPKPKVTRRQNEIADDILSKFDPSKSTAQLNEHFPDTLNAKQQVKLWHKAREEAVKKVLRGKRNKERRERDIFDNTVKIYNALEDKLISRGLVPRIGTGDNVKLSDVIADLSSRNIPITDDILREFGDAVKQGSPVYNSIQRLRARGAINDSQSVRLLTERINQLQGQVKKSNRYTEAEIKDFDKLFQNIGKDAAKSSGISPASINAVQKMLKLSTETGKSAARVVTEQKARMIEEVVAKGKANAEVNRAITRALEKDLGTIPKWSVSENKVIEWIMSRVATWWGQDDLRPYSLNMAASAQATAVARGKALDRLFENFDVPSRQEAFNLAQGYGKASSPEIAELANQINRMVSDLIGQAAGSSVLLRSGVHMDMLNKWMQHYKVGFSFSKKAKDKLTGTFVDLSKGTDWVNSWKYADAGDNPKAFLFKLQQAVEQATREKALFDDIGERFGSPVPGKGYRYKVEGHPYIEPYYFTKDIADQIPRVVRDWATTNMQPKGKVLAFYDRLLTMWKSLVTIYKPAHHIRNMVGDAYLGWLDGVNSTKPYLLAAKVQKSVKGAYQDFADIDRLIEIGAYPKSWKTPAPKDVIFKNKSGVPFTSEQIYSVAHQKGLLETFSSMEDLLDTGQQGRGLLNVKPFGGRVQDAARTVSETQGHNARLAHFIDKVMKSRGNNLDEIFEQASRRARKWHPTGLDLTDFEKKYMRRIMPFYSWTRKSIPLLVEGLVMNPGKTVIPAKVFDAIQNAQGIETPGRHDPFPVDQMFPDWIKSYGLGPLSEGDGLLGKFSNQSPPGYVMGGMGLNPTSDLGSQLEDPLRTLASSLSPIVQVPMELLQRRKIYTGEPILGDDARPGSFQQYIGEQIPIFSDLQRVTGVTPFGTDTKSSLRSGGEAAKEAFINWLTGAGIKGTGPYIKQAQFEEDNPLRLQRQVARDELLAELRKLTGG